MKILILKVQTIGDTLLTTPLARNLKQYYPDAMIDFMVNEGTQQMLDANSKVNQVIEYKRESQRSLSNWQRFVNNIALLKRIRGEKYDLVIDLDEGDRGALVTLISGAKTKLGSSDISSKFLRGAYTHLLPKRGTRHTVDINLDPLRVLDIPIIDKRVEMCWGEADEKLVLGKLSGVGDFIHLHPFSKGWFKDIDNHTTAKIIDHCQQTLGFKVVVTAAPIQRELERLDEILALCQSQPINLGGQLSLRQTAALNHKAKLFIGVDTAVMHISAANNIPTIGFFGPTAPDVWGPWDNDLKAVSYHRKGGVQFNGKHRVISDIRSCIPCNQEGCNNMQKSQCLVSLDASIVQKHIGDMLT